MKAYHIMMFMLIFNLFFWVVTAGIGIYVAPVSGDSDFDLSDKTDQGAWTGDGMGIINVFTLFNNKIASVFILASTIAGAALIGWVVSQQAPQGIVYGFFAYFFWSSMSNTFTVFYNMANQNIGVMYVLAIFGMLIAVIFVIGLFQMVTGGWKAHE